MPTSEPSTSTCCTASATPAACCPDASLVPTGACCAEAPAPSRRLRDQIVDPFVQLALLR